MLGVYDAMFLTYWNLAHFNNNRTVENVAAIDDRGRVISVREVYSCARILYSLRRWGSLSDSTVRVSAKTSMRGNGQNMKFHAFFVSGLK